MRIKSDQCDYDMEYGAFGDTVPCGASTGACPQENCSSTITDRCETHMHQCTKRPDCYFIGCGACVDTHEETCGKRQSIIDAMDNPCAALEVA